MNLGVDRKEFSPKPKYEINKQQIKQISTYDDSSGACTCQLGTDCYLDLAFRSPWRQVSTRMD